MIIIIRRNRNRTGAHADQIRARMEYEVENEDKELSVNTPDDHSQDQRSYNKTLHVPEPQDPNSGTQNDTPERWT